MKEYCPYCGSEDFIDIDFAHFCKNCQGIFRKPEKEEERKIDYAL